jgi:hypothetical protein
MSQQTAVEWLVKEFGLEDFKATIMFAKAKEKEQIIDSYSFGYTNGFDDAKLPIPIRVDDGEQYYNETFNK